MSLHTFAVRDLSVFAYTQGFTFWCYAGAVKAAVSARATLRPGFWNDAHGLFAVGDLIWAPDPDGGVQLSVTRSNPGDVQVRAFDAFPSRRGFDGGAQLAVTPSNPGDVPSRRGFVGGAVGAGVRERLAGLMG